MSKVTVRMGTVWDRTTAILGARGGTLAGIALLAFFAPAVIQAALTAYTIPGTGIAVMGTVVGILVLLATIWGQLATIALALDPATTRTTASRAAVARLPAAILVVIVLIAGFVLLFAPIGVALASSGFDFAAAAASQQTGVMPPVPAGTRVFVALYAIVALIVLLWLIARLFVTMPVVLAERRGIGALGRSFRLTRGLALRIVGVLILYLIVVGVTSLAVRSVAGIIFRLIFGGEGGTALFLTAVAEAAVAAVFSVLATVFTAQLYVAARDRQAEPAQPA